MIYEKSIKVGDFISFKNISVELESNPALHIGKKYKVLNVNYSEENRVVQLELYGVKLTVNRKFVNPVYVDYIGRERANVMSTINLEKKCSNFNQEELEI
jgi:hypothetical protein